MKKQPMKNSTNMAVGLAIGATCAAIGTKMLTKNKRGFRKTANKTMKNINTMLDGINQMMG